MSVRGGGRIAAAIVACAVVGRIAWKQVPAYRAYRRFHDITWWKTASPDERRQTAHSALGAWRADPHDAFLALLDDGDESSIPFLRAALARRPAGDAVACTWWHGQAALKRILERTGR